MCLEFQVVVRGDIGTGKTSLVKRLRGGGYTETYETRRVFGPLLLLRPLLEHRLVAQRFQQRSSEKTSESLCI